MKEKLCIFSFSSKYELLGFIALHLRFPTLIPPSSVTLGGHSVLCVLSVTESPCLIELWEDHVSYRQSAGDGVSAVSGQLFWLILFLVTRLRHRADGVDCQRRLSGSVADRV